MADDGENDNKSLINGLTVTQNEYLKTKLIEYENEILEQRKVIKELGKNNEELIGKISKNNETLMELLKRGSKSHGFILEHKEEIARKEKELDLLKAKYELLQNINIAGISENGNATTSMIRKDCQTNIKNDGDNDVIFLKELKITPSLVINRKIKTEKRRSLTKKCQLKTESIASRNNIEYLDTVDLVTKFRACLKENKITQKTVANKLLNCSDSEISRIILTPKPWSKLTERTKLPYLKMHKFLCDPKNIQNLKNKKQK